jgi:hypothetical protein
MLPAGAGMKDIDTYLLLLPSGAGGHAGDAEWLLGCRDQEVRGTAAGASS